MKRAATSTSEGGTAKKARAEGYGPTVMDFFLEDCAKNVEDFAMVADGHRWFPTAAHERVGDSDALQGSGCTTADLDLVFQCLFQDHRMEWVYKDATESSIIDAISSNSWQLHPAHAALWKEFQDSASSAAVQTLLELHSVATLGAGMTEANAVIYLRSAGRRRYELALKTAIKATPIKATAIKATPIKATTIEATLIKATTIEAAPVAARAQVPKVVPLVVTTPVPADGSFGTSLVGYIKNCKYADLVKHFGPPTIGPDAVEDKSTCEWNFCLEDYEINIYDWKVFKTPKFAYDWHIGGMDKEVVGILRKYMPGMRVVEE
jgi:hypothetical protein